MMIFSNLFFKKKLPSLSVMLLLDSDLRQLNHVRQRVAACLERNSKVVVIIESTSSRADAKFTSFLASLCDMPRLFILNSSSHVQSAIFLQVIICLRSTFFLIFLKDLFHRERDDRFVFDSDWIFENQAKLLFLLKAPHCGVGRSISLLKKFRSVREIVTSTPLQLQKAMGSITLGECEKMSAFWGGKQ